MKYLTIVLFLIAATTVGAQTYSNAQLMEGGTIQTEDGEFSIITSGKTLTVHLKFNDVDIKKIGRITSKNRKRLVAKTSSGHKLVITKNPKGRTVSTEAFIIHLF